MAQAQQEAAPPAGIFGAQQQQPQRGGSSRLDVPYAGPDHPGSPEAPQAPADGTLNAGLLPPYDEPASAAAKVRACMCARIVCVCVRLRLYRCVLVCLAESRRACAMIDGCVCLCLCLYFCVRMRAFV